MIIKLIINQIPRLHGAKLSKQALGRIALPSSIVCGELSFIAGERTMFDFVPVPIEKIS